MVLPDPLPIFDTAFPYSLGGRAVASTADAFGTTRTLPRGWYQRSVVEQPDGGAEGHAGGLQCFACCAFGGTVTLGLRDVMSPAARKQKGIHLERLDRYDQDEDAWIEAVVEDHRTPVPEQTAFRIDFPDWLGSLPRRHRRAAELLAVGNTTGEVAQRCHVTPGRISQMRRELHRSWQRFHGEEVAARPAAVPAA